MQQQRRDYKKTRHGYESPDWTSEIKPEWIKEGMDDEGVKFADKLGLNLANGQMSTSQIRNIYGELKRIQMIGFEKEKTSFLLLLPKVAYAAKRNEKQGIKTFKTVFDKVHAMVKTEKDYGNMMNLMEAILAYHKAYEK